MIFNFRKLKVGEVVTAYCCDHCIGLRNMKMKSLADSGGKSWLCDLCGHYGIGSQMLCKVETWNRLIPLPYEPQTASAGEGE